MEGMESNVCVCVLCDATQARMEETERREKREEEGGRKEERGKREEGRGKRGVYSLETSQALAISRHIFRMTSRL